MLEFIANNHLGDLASIAGVVISIIGFIIAIWNILRSKSAAERAQKAAEETHGAIRKYETVSEISAAVTKMDEIKRLQRAGNIEHLPDRYADLRKILITVRSLAPELTDGQQTIIQEALTTLTSVEAHIDKCNAKGLPLNIAKINKLISQDEDALQAVLVDLRNQIGANQ